MMGGEKGRRGRWELWLTWLNRNVDGSLRDDLQGHWMLALDVGFAQTQKDHPGKIKKPIGEGFLNSSGTLHVVDRCIDGPEIQIGGCVRCQD